jgi:YHS domain-containing protein
MRQIAILTMLLLSLAAMAQNDALRLKHFNLGGNHLAIEGYDPVAYFEGKPAKGSSAHSYTYKAVLYYFTSAAHLEVFKKDPAKYEPQYGGWCAFAMGDYGEKVSINPETYKILEGKLYLFYNAFFTNTLPKWNKDEQNLKKAADINWKNTFK